MTSSISEPTGQSTWGADVPISMPEPIAVDPGVKAGLGGLAFISTGHVPDLTEVDREALLMSGYSPPGGVDG